jgi:hypothetical protein
MSITTRLVLVDKDTLFTVVEAWAKQNKYRLTDRSSDSATYGGGIRGKGLFVRARYEGKIAYLDAWWVNITGKHPIDKGLGGGLNPFVQPLKTAYNSLLSTFGLAQLN